jgi:hypothetical protein
MILYILLTLKDSIILPPSHFIRAILTKLHYSLIMFLPYFFNNIDIILYILLTLEDSIILPPFRFIRTILIYRYKYKHIIRSCLICFDEYFQNIQFL